ncbi:MAG TPA: hypothetical protein VIE89_36900 [Candidatus Binatia bacterium]|jgi:hypothetical protein
MKIQRWNVALALAFALIASGSAISGPTSIRPTTERTLLTGAIAGSGYAHDSYDYSGVVASWKDAVIFQNGIQYLSPPVFGPWPEKALGRYSIMGEKTLYSIRGEGGWPKYSIWGEGGWPGLDVEQTFIPSPQVKNEYANDPDASLLIPETLQSVNYLCFVGLVEQVCLPINFSGE